MVEADDSNYLKISDLKGECSFEVVKSRFSNGLEITKCVYEFFLQLAGLEESFAHGLQKLLRSAPYTLHSNTLMQWLGQDPFEETGTLKEAWRLIGDCLSLTAKHHLEKAYLLKQSVAEPLNEIKLQLEETRKQNLKENKYTSIRKLRNQLKAERLKLDTINTECSKLKGQLDTNRVNSSSCKSSLKLEEQIYAVEAQIRDQEHLCGKYEQEYSIAERGNTLQLEYIYTTIHESEWIRISKIRTSLIEFSKVYSNTGPVYLQYCQKLAIRMSDVDADRDIHEFVTAHQNLIYAEDIGANNLEDLEASRSVTKIYSSYSHPLSHSHSTGSSPKKEVDIVSAANKEPATSAPKPKTSKSNLPDFRIPKEHSEPIIPPTISSTPKPPKPDKNLPIPVQSNEPKASVVSPTKAPPRFPPPTHVPIAAVPNEVSSTTPTTTPRAEEKRESPACSVPVYSKIPVQATDPILPVLHKELKSVDSNINEIVSMQMTLIKMSEANDYYRIINGSHDDDVEHLDELRRNITKKLHPDQFADQPVLQRKANNKLAYLNTIYTDVLLKEEVRKIYNILCQYRKAYSQITSQDINSLKVAMEKFQKIFKFFKRNEVPSQLIQEVEMALKLLNACIKRSSN